MNDLQNHDAEELLLAAILADENAIVVVRDLVQPRDFFHERCRAVAEAAWSCLALDPPVPPTRAVVLDRLHALGRAAAVAPSYVADLDDRGTGQVVGAASRHARIIGKLAAARRAIAVCRDLEQQIAAHPDDLDTLVNGGSQELLAQLDGGGTERAADIQSILDHTPVDTEVAVPTGLHWLDSLITGWRRGKITTISGQYKGRKTTLALYLMMRVLLAGKKNVSIFTVDDDRETFGWQLVAMVATLFLRKWDVPVAQWRLNDEFVQLPPDQHTAEQRDAIAQARARLNGIKHRLRIYDTKDGAADFDTVERVLRRDALLHGCDMYMMDFMQDLELSPTSRYRTRQMSDHIAFETVVKRFKLLTTRHNLTGLWLSQLSDEALKGRAGRSAGTKGGVSIPAATNVLIETSKPDDHHINVHLKLGRKSANGEIAYAVNAPSGLILNPEAMPW